MANKPEYVVFTDSIKALDYIMREDSIENMVITKEGIITEVRDSIKYVQNVSGGKIRCEKYVGDNIMDSTYSMAIRELSPFSKTMKKEGEFYIEFNVRSPFFAPWD